MCNIATDRLLVQILSSLLENIGSANTCLYKIINYDTKCLHVLPFKLQNISARNNSWPFSDQFQHLADQNPFWSANFTVHFQWDGNQ